MMNYNICMIEKGEYMMNIIDNAIMLSDAINEAKRVAMKNEFKILRVYQNGVYLFEYFTKPDKLSIAK